MKKIDWITIILCAIIILSITVIAQYYYNAESIKCMGNPLVYAANKYEKEYGYSFYGTGYFKLNGTSPIIYFDSTNVSSSIQ